MNDIEFEEIKKFFIDEENRKEFLETVVFFKDMETFSYFLKRLEPRISELPLKAKRFYAYLWLKKTNLPIEDLPEEIFKATLPEIRLYDEENAGIRMGSKKRYLVPMKKIVELTTKRTTKEEFSIWVNNAYASFNLKVLTLFMKHEVFYNAINKKPTVKVVSQFFWNKSGLYWLKENPDKKLAKDILEIEYKNRKKLMQLNFDSYMNYVNHIAFNNLSQNEKQEIFDFKTSILKEYCNQAIDNNKERVYLKKAEEELVLFIKNFQYKKWETFLNDFILSTPSFYLKDIRIGLRKNYVYEKDGISPFLLREYLLKLGFGTPRITFYEQKDFLTEKDIKSKLLIAYGLDINNVSRETLLVKMFDTNKTYKDYLMTGLWYNIIPLEIFAFLKNEFPNLLKKKDEQIGWDFQALDLFVDLIYYADKDFTLTEDLKNILLLNHKY